MPVTDIRVVRPREVYHREVYQLGMSVRLLAVPDWAEQCIVEPVTTIGREALALLRFEFAVADGIVDDLGVLLQGEEPLHCSVEQPVQAPALDCPLQGRLVGDGREQVLVVGGVRRLRLRPFDPSRDALTQHEQTDARLLAMYAALDDPRFDSEDVRAF